jgi:hypothetical protein
MKGIHPVVKKCGLHKTSLPNIALRLIGKFVSSPNSDEIRGLKKLYLEKVFITGVSRRIMPKVNRYNLPNIHKKVIKKNINALSSKMKDMSLDNIRNELFKINSYSKISELEKRFIPHSHLRYRYTHGPILKVYSNKNYLLKKADMWLETKFLEQLLGDDITKIYNYIYREINKHIIEGTSWYDIINHKIRRRVNNDVLLGSIMSLTKGNTSTNRIKDILIKQLFNYSLFSKTIQMNDITLSMLSNIRIMCNPEYVKRHIRVRLKYNDKTNKDSVLKEAFRIFPRMKRSELRKMRKDELVRFVGMNVLDIHSIRNKKIHYKITNDIDLSKEDSKGIMYRIKTNDSNLDFEYYFKPTTFNEYLWDKYWYSIINVKKKYNTNKCYIHIRKPFMNYMREFYMSINDFMSYVDNSSSDVLEFVKVDIPSRKE